MLALSACRADVAGPEVEPPPAAAPPLEGAWRGSFIGRMALLGPPGPPVIRDTFLVELRIQHHADDLAGDRYAADGRVWRDDATSGVNYLYDCFLDDVSVRPDSTGSYDCVQQALPRDTLIFRLQVKSEPSGNTLAGRVYDGAGFKGEEYGIALTRTAARGSLRCGGDGETPSLGCHSPAGMEARAEAVHGTGSLTDPRRPER